MRKKRKISAFLFGIALWAAMAGGCGRTVGEAAVKVSTAVEDTVLETEEEKAKDRASKVGTGKSATEKTEEEPTAGREFRQVEAVTAENAVVGNGTAINGTAVNEAAASEAAVNKTAVNGAAASGAAESKSAGDSSKFVLLAEAVPDVIQEIRYYSTYNFVGDRIDGYEEPCAILTKEAAAALKEVSDEIKAKGYRLKVYDAYRPQSAVDHFRRWAADTGDTRMKAYFYPDLDKTALFEQSYIGRKSGHSRGSTVDLTLFDMNTGKEVDMGGTFDYFGRRSHPDYTGDLTAEQINNRRILRDVMVSHGFKPLSTEWWHFTLNQEPYPDTYFNFPVSSDGFSGNGVK